MIYKLCYKDLKEKYKHNNSWARIIMSNLDKSLSTFTEPKNNDYVDVCNCHEPERYLRFDVKDKCYYGICGCNEEFTCAKLQINKHKIIRFSKSRRLLDPLFHQARKMPKNLKSEYDQTLDKFFAE